MKKKVVFDLFKSPKQLYLSIVGVFLWLRSDTILFDVIDEKCLAVLDAIDKENQMKNQRITFFCFSECQC